MERQWMTLDQIKVEYASNDYNPELLLQHLLHHVEASPASVPADVPYYKVADRGFRWDSENQQHIPQLLIEFTPVPANAPNDSTGWKDRDTLATMLAAASSTSYHWKDCPDCRKSAPTPTSTEDRWQPIATNEAKK